MSYRYNRAMETIRTFIAINLTEETRTAVTKMQSQLKSKTPPYSVRWIAPQTMHLTLHFLGDTDTTKIDDIAAVLKECASGYQSFPLTIAGLGCFPNLRRPRVIWLGLDHNATPLKQLHSTLGEMLNQTIGFEPENRPYSPHLTIGRVKKGIPERHLRQLAAMLTEQQARIKILSVLPIKSIHLMQSELKPTGPIYTSLAEVTIE